MLVPGRVYLVPSLLGVVPPDAVLPKRTIDVARSIRSWLVETPKAARAFLKTLALDCPISELTIEPIGEQPNRARLRALLSPAHRGQDIGVLSDAGCPAVVDPGALIVAAAHDEKLQVVPLVGPSSLLLALMASGMNGQRFAFHGYLPVEAQPRAQAIRRLEKESRARRCTELFIETPYRNVALLGALVVTLEPDTRLCVAADLTLPTETVVSQPVAGWKGTSFAAFARRPAVFVIEARG